jgi:hypothetical protein
VVLVEGKMESPISPWHTETLQLESPDKTMVAVLSEPREIAMGAPTSGELKVSNGLSGFNCNPSMIWSDDSIYLAVPQWSQSMQRLMVLNTIRRKRWFAPGLFRVLALVSFNNGIVEGIDSPIHEPRKVRIDVRSLFPED